MGLNATAAMWPKGSANLSSLYTARYAIGRIDRLYLPFLVVFAASSLIALSDGTLSATAMLYGLATGALPVSGPGNYFIGFAFQFAILFPAFYWLFRRYPEMTIVAGFVAAAAFDLLAGLTPLFDELPFSYFYSEAFPRFIPFFALGALQATWMLSSRAVPRWWWFGTGASIAYLLLVYCSPLMFPLSNYDWRPTGQTFASAFYPATLVILGLRWLPDTSTSALYRLLSYLGRASYEIFLVQILWFGLIGASVTGLPLDSLVACCILGLTLHRCLKGFSLAKILSNPR